MTDLRGIADGQARGLHPLLAWLALCAILLATSLPRIAEGRFPDPDDALRLVQVRDLLAGQGWFDLHQYRINPPDGTLMHWSRLVDIPIALVILLVTPIAGQANAEMAALIAVPLLTLGAIVAVVARMARSSFDARTAGLACLCIGTLPILMLQLQPMRIDHHGWQIFSFIAAVWAISWRNPAKGGAAAGLAMAMGLSISIELLPLAGAIAAILLLRWLRDHQSRGWLVSYLAVFASALVAFFLATRGLADIAQHCDAISPAHLGFFVIAALGTAAIASIPRPPPAATATLFGLVGAGAFAWFALSVPQCLGSPFAGLDPLVHDYWYVNVLEGQPFWRQRLAEAAPLLLQNIVALGAAIALWLGERPRARSWWGEYALLLCAAIVLSLFVWRSIGFASVLAAVPLGWLTARLLETFSKAETLRRKCAIIAALLLVLAPYLPIIASRHLLPQSETGSNASGAESLGESRCEIRDQAVRLNRLAPATIFAPLDIGPTILLKSHHAVVATSHHRAQAAMADVIRAFISPPEAARPIIAAHGADYIVVCTDLIEPGIYADSNAKGLMARLLAGDPPHWLEKLHFDAPRQFAVWRVRDGAVSRGGNPAPAR